jgi:hypothetical protein
MKKLIALIQKFWAWCVKAFTGKAFIIAFPFTVFVLAAFFTWSWVFFVCAIIWLFPLILGIHEDE